MVRAHRGGLFLYIFILVLPGAAVRQHDVDLEFDGRRAPHLITDAQASGPLNCSKPSSDNPGYGNPSRQGLLVVERVQAEELSPLLRQGWNYRVRADATCGVAASWTGKAAEASVVPWPNPEDPRNSSIESFIHPQTELDMRLRRTEAVRCMENDDRNEAKCLCQLMGAEKTEHWAILGHLAAMLRHFDGLKTLSQKCSHLQLTMERRSGSPWVMDLALTTMVVPLICFFFVAAEAMIARQRATGGRSFEVPASNGGEEKEYDAPIVLTSPWKATHRSVAMAFGFVSLIIAWQKTETELTVVAFEQVVRICLDGRDPTNKEELQNENQSDGRKFRVLRDIWWHRKMVYQLTQSTTGFCVLPSLALAALLLLATSTIQAANFACSRGELNNLDIVIANSTLNFEPWRDRLVSIAPVRTVPMLISIAGANQSSSWRKCAGWGTLPGTIITVPPDSPTLNGELCTRDHWPTEGSAPGCCISMNTSDGMITFPDVHPFGKGVLSARLSLYMTNFNLENILGVLSSRLTRLQRLTLDEVGIPNRFGWQYLIYFMGCVQELELKESMSLTGYSVEGLAEGALSRSRRSMDCEPLTIILPTMEDVKDLKAEINRTLDPTAALKVKVVYKHSE